MLLLVSSLIMPVKSITTVSYQVFYVQMVVATCSVSILWKVPPFPPWPTLTVSVESPTHPLVNKIRWDGVVYQQSILIWYDNFLNQTFAKFAVGWMPSLYSWKLYWFLAFILLFLLLVLILCWMSVEKFGVLVPKVLLI
jgi:hypothetical protein